MSKGFTLIEMVLVVIVLTILSGFTFSVIWQYSRIYADTKGGYVYSEAAAVLERMSRELRDAELVDTLGASPATYINFWLANGTPSGTTVPPYWVQYCTCSSAGRTYLYRVQNTSQGASNYCQSACPTAGADTSLMSRNIMSSGFQITLPDVGSYEIKLKLASDGSAGNPSITLVTRVSPRNYVGLSTGRSFSGGYKDAVN